MPHLNQAKKKVKSLLEEGASKFSSKKWKIATFKDYGVDMDVLDELLSIIIERAEEISEQSASVKENAQAISDYCLFE